MGVLTKVIGQCRDLGKKVEAVESKKKALENDGRLSAGGRTETLNEFIQQQDVGMACLEIQRGIDDAKNAFGEKWSAEFAERLGDAAYQAKLERAEAYLLGEVEKPDYALDAINDMFRGDWDALHRLSKAGLPGVKKSDPRMETLQRLDTIRLNLTQNVNAVTVRNNPQFALLFIEGAIETLSKLEGDNR